MTIPTVDQTEGIWIARTNNQGYHYIQAVFPKKDHSDQEHLSNCRALIQRGSLQPEFDDHILPERRAWDQTQRYYRVHV